MEIRTIALILCLTATSLAAVVFPDFSVNTTTHAPTSSTTTTIKPSSSTTVRPTSTPAPTSSTTTSKPTTTPAPTSSTTTSKPTTTPAPTSSTTTSKPTSTPAPTSSTTTSKPTSSTPPPSTSSTSAPSTSTSAPTTTAAPPSKIGEWIVKDDATNVTCVLVKMAFSLNVTYPTVKNTTDTAVLTPMAINVNGTVVNGTCGNLTQSISIPLDHGLLTLEFALDSSKSTLKAITLNATDLSDKIVNASSIYNETAPLFATPVKMSYKCSKEQSVNLTSVDNSTAVFIFSDVQLQAFRVENATNFSEAQDCETADTPDMVPIAVGVSLGVMIVVVLVAYLIGRRRSQGSGYVSM